MSENKASVINFTCMENLYLVNKNSLNYMLASFKHLRFPYRNMVNALPMSDHTSDCIIMVSEAISKVSSFTDNA